MKFEDIKKMVKEDTSYEFLKTTETLGKNIVLLGLGGSHAYGTNIETSDVDLRGITLNPRSELLMGSLVANPFEQYVEHETDTVIYAFNKMIDLLISCNPNTIEIMGLPREEYLILTDIGERLLQLKDAFLSKKCINTFKGYANQQMYRLRQKSLCAMSEEDYNMHISKVLNQMMLHLQKHYAIDLQQIKAYVENEKLLIDCNLKGVNAETLAGVLGEINTTINAYNKNSKRNKKAVEHGKINKHSMHLLRLYMMGIDMMDKHEIITKRTEEHDLLMSIRNGEWLGEDGKPNEDFFKLVEEYEQRFDEACKRTTLPDNPDYDTIYTFVKEVNQDIILGKL